MDLEDYRDFNDPRFPDWSPWRVVKAIAGLQLAGTLVLSGIADPQRMSNNIRGGYNTLSETLGKRKPEDIAEDRAVDWIQTGDGDSIAQPLIDSPPLVRNINPAYTRVPWWQHFKRPRTEPVNTGSIPTPVDYSNSYLIRRRRFRRRRRPFRRYRRRRPYRRRRYRRRRY